MLTDQEIDDACKSEPAAVYELMHGHEITAGAFKAALRAVSRAIEALVRAECVPPGYKLIAVKGFDELMQALDRADRKGYLPDAVADEWDAFDYELPAAPTITAAQGEQS